MYEILLGTQGGPLEGFQISGVMLFLNDYLRRRQMMEESKSLSELSRALAELDEDRIVILVQQYLDNNIAPEQIIHELSSGIT